MEENKDRKKKRRRVGLCSPTEWLRKLLRQRCLHRQRSSQRHLRLSPTWETLQLHSLLRAYVQAVGTIATRDGEVDGKVLRGRGRDQRGEGGRRR